MGDETDVGDLIRRLYQEAAASDVARVVLPGERPVALHLADEWIQAMAGQGYLLDAWVSQDRSLAFVKMWEYGDVEPSRQEVEAQARPSLGYSFRATDAARQWCDLIVDALNRKGLGDAEAVNLIEAKHAELPFLSDTRIDIVRTRSPEDWAARLVGPS